MKACPEWGSELSQFGGRADLEPPSPVSVPEYVLLCHPTVLVSVLCPSVMCGVGNIHSNQGSGM